MSSPEQNYLSLFAMRYPVLGSYERKIFHQVEKQTSHNMYSLLAYWDRVAGGQILMTAHLFPVMKQSWSCLLFSTPSRSNRIKQSPACYYKENSIIFSSFEVRESYLQLVSVSSTAPICHVFRPLQDQNIEHIFLFFSFFRCSC